MDADVISDVDTSVALVVAVKVGIDDEVVVAVSADTTAVMGETVGKIMAVGRER